MTSRLPAHARTDLEVAFVASSAALALDQILRGQQSDLKPVVDLEPRRLYRRPRQDGFGLVEPDDRLGQRVVVGVAATPDGRFSARARPFLAAAGVLSGHRATSNKRVFSLAVEQDPTVQWVGEARWVEDGKYITSSGVSAGTDMALGLIASLYGVERASALARSLEYVWNPDSSNDPFAILLPAF